jgi:uncharacterized Zn finger protein (UPF0148 family)
MPNRYDVDVHCEECGAHLYSYMHESEKTDQRFCNRGCERAFTFKKEQADARKQIEQARENLLQLKKTSPYIFPEWQRLERAKQAVEDARKELIAARVAWFMLGKEK